MTGPGQVWDRRWRTRTRELLPMISFELAKVIWIFRWGTIRVPARLGMVALEILDIC